MKDFLIGKTIQFYNAKLEKLEKLAEENEGGNCSRLIRKITDDYLKKESK